MERNARRTEARSPDTKNDDESRLDDCKKPRHKSPKSLWWYHECILLIDLPNISTIANSVEMTTKKFDTYISSILNSTVKYFSLSRSNVFFNATIHRYYFNPRWFVLIVYFMFHQWSPVPDIVEHLKWKWHHLRPCAKFRLKSYRQRKRHLRKRREERENVYRGYRGRERVRVRNDARETKDRSGKMRKGQNEKRKRREESHLVDFSERRGGVSFPLRRHVTGSENTAAAAMVNRGMPFGVEEREGRRGWERNERQRERLVGVAGGAGKRRRRENWSVAVKVRLWKGKYFIIEKLRLNGNVSLFTRHRHIKVRARRPDRGR